MWREREWAGHYKGGRSAVGGRVSLGLFGLKLEVSKLNMHIHGESCKDLVFCKKCLIKGSGSSGSYLSPLLLHESVAHFTLRRQDVSILSASSCCLLLLCKNYMSVRQSRWVQRREREVENKGGWTIYAQGENVRHLWCENWKDIAQYDSSPTTSVKGAGCFSMVSEVGSATLCTSASVQAAQRIFVFLQVAACVLGVANLCLCRRWQL